MAGRAMVAVGETVWERRLSMKGIRRIGRTGMSVRDKGYCGVRDKGSQSYRFNGLNLDLSSS